MLLQESFIIQNASWKLRETKNTKQKIDKISANQNIL